MPSLTLIAVIFFPLYVLSSAASRLSLSPSHSYSFVLLLDVKLPLSASYTNE